MKGIGFALGQFEAWAVGLRVAIVMLADLSRVNPEAEHTLICNSMYTVHVSAWVLEVCNSYIYFEVASTTSTWGLPCLPFPCASLEGTHYMYSPCTNILDLVISFPHNLTPFPLATLLRVCGASAGTHG